MRAHPYGVDFAHGAGVIVAVRKSLALKVDPLPGEVLTFRNAVLLRDLMPRLEVFRKVQ